ncbi:hypothetical protein MLD38_001895 [Melastoma candidum]|uniref:Uncharacterized protein n=1 Tax=Melastoma candidum TaxID=119954 RepID=A0ACB9SGP1_9MYRT|nr:hypothetical protein MLD38_001895 [Melastoma candidum]
MHYAGCCSWDGAILPTALSSVCAILITTFFYLCYGCFSYAAFGMNTPGSLLTGFETFRPHSFLDFANACITLHLWGGYQAYVQTKNAAKKFLHGDFDNKMYKLKLPLLPAVLNPLHLCFRSALRCDHCRDHTPIPLFQLHSWEPRVTRLLTASNFLPCGNVLPAEGQRNLV